MNSEPKSICKICERFPIIKTKWIGVDLKFIRYSKIGIAQSCAIFWTGLLCIIKYIKASGVLENVTLSILACGILVVVLKLMNSFS